VSALKPRDLSCAGYDALIDLLSCLPRDQRWPGAPSVEPAPLCARMVLVLDGVRALSLRQDLPATDRQIFATWLRPEVQILIAEHLVQFVDAVVLEAAVAVAAGKP